MWVDDKFDLTSVLWEEREGVVVDDRCDFVSVPCKWCQDWVDDSFYRASVLSEEEEEEKEEGAVISVGRRQM